MIKYFTATVSGQYSCFPESIKVGTEICIYDRPVPFKKTIEQIGLNSSWQIPAFASSDLDMIKNSMLHYDNVWICVNAPYDVIGCIGFNNEPRN